MCKTGLDKTDWFDVVGMGGSPFLFGIDGNVTVGEAKVLRKFRESYEIFLN